MFTETGQEEEVIEFILSTEDNLKERGVNMSLFSDLNKEFSINPDAQILFSSSRPELNDMVSIAPKFHTLKKSARWRRLSRLVPQSQR